jgi:tetratricopeptide (TPR) repeat protein
MTDNHLLLYRLAELMLEHEQHILPVDLLFDDEQIGDFAKSIQIDSPYQQMLIEGVFTESVNDEKLYVCFTVEGYFHFVLGEVIYHRTEGLGAEDLKQIVEGNKLNGLRQGVEQFLNRVLVDDRIGFITSLIDLDKYFVRECINPISKKLISFKRINQNDFIFDVFKIESFFQELLLIPTNKDYEFLTLLIKHLSNNHQYLLLDLISDILIKKIIKLDFNDFPLFLQLVIHNSQISNYLDDIHEFYQANIEYLIDYRIARDISRIYDKCNKLNFSIDYLVTAKSLIGMGDASLSIRHQIYHNLGQLYIENGQYDLASSYLLDALKIQSEENHYVQNALTNLCIHKGELIDAMDYCLKVYAFRVEKFGLYHEETAVALNNLGLTSYYMDKVIEGVDYLEKCLEVRTRLFGKRHITTISTISNLSGLILKLGDTAKAKSYVKEAIRLSRKIDIQKSKESLSSSYEVFAMINKEEGNYDHAIKYYKISISILKKVNGLNHQYVKNNYRQISDVYIEMKDYYKALYYARKALKIDLFTYGLSNRRTGYSYAKIGKIYFDMQELQSSIDFYERSLNVLNETLGENHEDTVTVQNKLNRIKDDL